MSKILITGESGYVGSYLVPYLSKIKNILILKWWNQLNWSKNEEFKSQRSNQN